MCSVQPRLLNSRNVCLHTVNSLGLVMSVGQCCPSLPHPASWFHSSLAGSPTKARSTWPARVVGTHCCCYRGVPVPLALLEMMSPCVFSAYAFLCKVTLMFLLLGPCSFSYTSYACWLFFSCQSNHASLKGCPNVKFKCTVQIL